MSLIDFDRIVCFFENNFFVLKILFFFVFEYYIWKRFGVLIFFRFDLFLISGWIV